MIVDSRDTLEGYPLFADVPAAGSGIVVAPRLIDLRRTPALSGEVHRRFMVGATVCEARAQVHVLTCADDQLQLVLADPATPFAFAPCAWAGAPVSRREIWQRE